MPLKFRLITGRTIEQGRSMEAEGKFSDGYRKAVALAEMNPKDVEILGIRNNAKIVSVYGSVVVGVKPNSDVPPGLVFIPMGPWANVLTLPATEGTGMPTLKNIDVHVEPTSEDPTPLSAILELYGVEKISHRPTERPLAIGSRRVVNDVPCPFCGEVCDFLTVELEGEKITRILNACPIGHAKIMNYHKHRVLTPMIKHEVNGDFIEVDLEQALNRAAEILATAKYPLIYGLSNTCVEAIELAVELAEITRGVIDNTTTLCHGPTVMAVQEVGAVKITLGMAMNLADTMVFWGCNPMSAHINHIRRVVIPEGKFVKGRKERKIIVVDVRRSETAKLADIFIQVEPGKDYELFTALRMALRDYDIEAPNVAGVPREKIYELVDIMRTARFGVIFFGMGLTQGGAKHKNLEEVIKLVQELNEWSKWTLLPMRGHYNVTGSNHAMLWLTGYPYGVEFSRGFPKMIPGVTTTIDLLMNSEVDAALIIASDPVAHFPQKAVENLMKLPKIVIDPFWSLTAGVADVLIPSGVTGIECEGTVYRLDDVALKVKKLVDPPKDVLCDTDILSRLISKVKKLKRLA
ncbi:MAG: formylmethanofuran dehydrogenase subunit B [Ignisphaera sp.]|nr:formylmethanofuran dehydrogenase subunit B [Ignisphaera sp.]MCX8168254.1 formylmethanofuran dehydrogenase subunit B [Ignisphaera sp.]MDW8084878.1 formylmethanofuran dehydrogenase subunit B [Ignisphaera sp.]